MHGVKREHDAAVLSAKRVQDAQRIAEFRAVLAAADAARAALRAPGSPADAVTAALEASARVLALNPSHYTMWNMRKEAVARLDAVAALVEERRLTLKCLQLSPKSYCIWEHRRWCLERAGLSDELRATELGLCEKLHALDSRNFHCWNYRRWLIGVRAHVAADLAYTLRRIQEDFSNYSAWHARSVAYGATPVGSAEWDLVLNAMYTGPQDQSVWMYVYWLLDKPRDDHPSEDIARLAHACCELLALDGEAQSKWAMLTLLRLMLLRRDGAVQVLPPAPHDSVAGLVDALVRVDPMRREFYESLRRQ